MSARKHIILLRIVAALEGFSWLILIGAMICEKMTGMHEPVSWSGRVHGGLFLTFGLVLFLASLEAKWTFKFTFLIGLSSLFPLGFLFADPFLKRKQKEATA